MTQFNLMESWKIVSKHTMSKEKGYGTKAIASVPYPSIFDSLIKKQMILQKIDFFFLFNRRNT